MPKSTRMEVRKTRRAAFASAEYLPLFQLALMDRSNPSGVLGPVLRNEHQNWHQWISSGHP